MTPNTTDQDAEGTADDNNRARLHLADLVHAMRRLFREPLLHFVLIGAALFAAFSSLSARDEAPADAIVVSAGKIEHLAALFARTWQRPPTRAELEGLINDFIHEEAAYREGMAVGLDRGDTIIRRRIRQKLEFIADDISNQVEPTDDELAAYLAAHPQDFRIDPRFTFRQVYLNSDQRGDSVVTDARELLIALNGDPTIDARTRGDRILLEHGYDDVSLRDIASLFGQRFAETVMELEPGVWQGPVESGYGVHLVFIDERTEGRLPDLDEARDTVLREFNNMRRVEAIETFYREMLERYEVVIEWPDLGTEDEDP